MDAAGNLTLLLLNNISQLKQASHIMYTDLECFITMEYVFVPRGEENSCSSSFVTTI